MNKKRLIVIVFLLVCYMFTRLNAESLFVKINDTVEIGSNINITIYLDNIKYDNFTFKLYSSETLENVNTNDIDLTNINNEEISFDYCINCSKLKNIVLNYKLPSSVDVGDSITLYAQVINKDSSEEVVDYRKVVNIIDKVKLEVNETNETDDKDKFRRSFSGGGFNFSNNKSNGGSPSVSTKYKGSTNNYLSNIVVKGYELNKKFIKERLTYFVTVPYEVKSLDLKVSKEDSNSNVSISGNGNFDVGLNKVLITVTAKDGRVKNYRIYVTRLESDSNEED